MHSLLASPLPLHAKVPIGSQGGYTAALPPSSTVICSGAANFRGMTTW